MVKTTDKSKVTIRNRGILLFLASLIILGAAVVYAFKENHNAVDEATSKANIEIYQRAARNSDPTICDQIKGGINATDNNNPANRDKNDFAVGVSADYKQMNEEQAKQNCRLNVQRAIDNKKDKN